jgi:serine protease Do
MSARATSVLGLFLAIAVGAAGTPAKTTAAPPALADTLEATLAKVVKIFGSGGVRNLEGYGTGLLVSPNGHLITVWSHLLDSGDVSVVLNDGRRFNAKFIKGDPARDLAVLKIEGENLDLPCFDLRETVDASPGTRVLAFSNMFKVATGDEPVSVVHGVVAARARLSARRGAFGAAYEGPVYIVDAVTNNPGAAGGALTTLDGRLVGMIGRELRNTDSNTWLNYAVPLTQLRQPITEIIAGRGPPPAPKSDAANLSKTSPIDLGLVMVPDVVYRTPAYVDSVIPESAAAKAGVITDDLIVFVNDELIQSNRILKTILGRIESGDAIRLVVRRRERLVSLELRVPEHRGK